MSISRAAAAESIRRFVKECRKLAIQHLKTNPMSNIMMLQEIRQQPEALERTLAHQWKGASKFRAFLETRKPRLVVIVARGTSDNAAQFGRYLIEIMTGIPVSLAAPSVHSIYNVRGCRLSGRAGGGAFAIGRIDGH